MSVAMSAASEVPAGMRLSPATIRSVPPNVEPVPRRE